MRACWEELVGQLVVDVGDAHYEWDVLYREVERVLVAGKDEEVMAQWEWAFPLLDGEDVLDGMRLMYLELVDLVFGIRGEGSRLVRHSDHALGVVRDWEVEGLGDE